MGNRLIVAFSLGLALATAACGDDDGGTLPDGGNVGDGGRNDGAVPDSGMDANMGLDGAQPDGQVPGEGGVLVDGMVIGPGGSVMKTITTAGGQIVSSDGVVTIDFPAGAFDRPTQVTIRPAATAIPGAKGPSYEILPSTEPLTPEGDRRVYVTFKYRAADVGAGGPVELQLGLYEGAGWTQLVLPTINPYPMGAIRAELPRLGPVGLYTGVCAACATTCQEPCMVGSVQGRCQPSGMGCGVCVPVCDADNDGFCPGEPGGGQPGGDCAPNDPTVHPVAGGGARPEASEICGNGKDDNCNGYSDEGCQACTIDSNCGAGQWCEGGFCTLCRLDCVPGMCTQFVDNGSVPGSCVMRSPVCNQCVPSCDTDGDFYCGAGAPNVGQRQGVDCDPANININPGATEVCNGVDDDCDSFVDEDCKTCSADSECPSGNACVAGACVGCTNTCTAENCRYPAGAAADAGVTGTCVTFGNTCNRCSPPGDTDQDGYLRNASGDVPGGDCAPDDPKIYPAQAGALEICGDNRDNNCDGYEDEGCRACTASSECPGQWACTNGVCRPCEGDFGDCRFDTDPMNPDAGVPGIRIDYGNGCRKCVRTTDADGDGFLSTGLATDFPPGGDCADTNAAVNPGMLEICGNGVDDNCKDGIDEACVTCEQPAMCGAGQSCSGR